MIRPFFGTSSPFLTCRKSALSGSIRPLFGTYRGRFEPLFSQFCPPICPSKCPSKTKKGAFLPLSFLLIQSLFKRHFNALFPALSARSCRCSLAALSLRFRLPQGFLRLLPESGSHGLKTRFFRSLRHLSVRCPLSLPRLFLAHKMPLSTLSIKPIYHPIKQNEKSRIEMQPKCNMKLNQCKLFVFSRHSSNLLSINNISYSCAAPFFLSAIHRWSSLCNFGEPFQDMNPNICIGYLADLPKMAEQTSYSC